MTDYSALNGRSLLSPLVKYALTFKIVEDTLETAGNLQELIETSKERVQVYLFPENEQLTQGNDGEVLTFPDGEINVPTGTPEFDLAEPIGFDDNAYFPKGDGFLDDVLNGRFEFPDEGEGLFTLFDAASSGIGLAREEKVADIVGGTLARDPQNPKRDLKVKGGGEGIKIDVLGPNGEYILVGGKAKGRDQKAVADTGERMARLKRVADSKGVEAKAYFVDDTPQPAIEIAKEKLGEENVFLFPEAQVD